MPWKENNNNNEPWGNPEDKSSNNQKKKGLEFDFDKAFMGLFSKIKKIFFSDPNNKKNFISAFLIFLIFDIMLIEHLLYLEVNQL